MDELLIVILPLIAGYLLDLLIGDPDHWPHPIRTFGWLIAKGDKWLNRDHYRFLKGMFLAILLCGLVYVFFSTLEQIIARVHFWLLILVNSIWVGYGLANKGLIIEGRNVFKVLRMKGVEAGRAQLSRIVGRDTSRLSPQQIRIAVMETMSENLSDGVIAPLFYYALAGVPGMMTYKMINTMDSMLGYRTDKYEQFGKFAARLDDIANFIPARITAVLMILVSGSWRGLVFIFRYGDKHKSPNAGYPEAALAGILNCRFGGPNIYHGILVEKPFIGEQDRIIEPDEIRKVVLVNHLTCLLAVAIIIRLYFWLHIPAT